MKYNKQADLRDQQAARWIDRDFDCSEYTEKHLRNALRFAKGCGGSESIARRKKLQEELNKRGLY